MESQWQDFLTSQGAHVQQNGVADFGDFHQELKATETQNCILDLSHEGLLKVEGIDAKQFLQGQITTNLNEISTKIAL